MKYRKVEIFTGTRFQVPAHIQRIDHKSTHGWQLRYGKWKMFSDHSNDGTGAKAALAAAAKELLKRIDALSAPTGLKRDIMPLKSSKHPVGISGPIGRTRKGRIVVEYNFGVTIPRFGDKPTNANVYIGTENTITKKRYKAALAKAVAIRKKAERAYQIAATKAKRANSRKKERA
jgi:hypothetical protein